MYYLRSRTAEGSSVLGLVVLVDSVLSFGFDGMGRPSMELESVFWDGNREKAAGGSMQ
jgi:hypothetical protein